MKYLLVPLLLLTAGCAPLPQPQALSAEYAAQATLAAGRELARELAVRSTLLALDIQQAESTQQHFAQQTAQAAQATATIQAMQFAATQQASQATATAQAMQFTATQQAVQATATAQQLVLAYQATHTAAVATATAQSALTATAWPLTATPQQATQMAIVAEAVHTERRSYWEQYVVPFWVFTGALVFILVLWGAVHAYRRLLPVLELRFRTIVSPDGEVITFLPSRDEVKAILPGRAAGPAIHSQRTQSQVSGLASDLALQDRTLERHQAARLAAVLPPTSRRSAGVPQTSGRITTTYRILKRGEHPPLLDSDTIDILEGQWRHADE